MIELRTHDAFPGGTLRADWEVLVDEDPAGTVFQTPRYLQLWHDMFGGRTTTRVRTVHSDGRLIGVIPEGHEREGSPTGPREVVRFLGGNDVTDYLGPISRPEDRDDVIAAWLEQLVEDRDWDEIEAGGLVADTGWGDAILRHADRLDLEVVEDGVDDVCPRVGIEGGFEAYLDRLGSKPRHELRRKSRKLARDVGGIELRRVAPEDLPKALDDFFEMAAETEDEKARFFLDDGMRAWFGALAEEFGADGTFVVHVLDVAGAPGAAAASFRYGREWGLYNSAFDQALRTLAPGMVLVTELIREVAEDGVEMFDLLRGDEPYKYRFGAEDRTLRRITLSRS